jgi:hypothetical protein
VNSTGTFNISFAVTGGPGRVLATHNGDNACHEPNHASWHSTYAGENRRTLQTLYNVCLPRFEDLDFVKTYFGQTMCSTFDDDGFDMLDSQQGWRERLSKSLSTTQARPASVHALPSSTRKPPTPPCISAMGRRHPPLLQWSRAARCDRQFFFSSACIPRPVLASHFIAM